jgi:hypothetical protein
MFSYKIVVARYNENIEWLKDEMKNCIIYNKGEKLNIDNEIMVENVGREAETYLNYIINNYDNLPDVVVFTQARISDHKKKDDVQYLLSIKNQAINHSKSQNYVTYDGITKNKHFDKEWNLQNGVFYLKDNYKNNKPMTFFNWFTIHIKKDYPEKLTFYLNAIFAVKRELILKNSLEYYKKMILEVNHHINPAEGHFFERSWFNIFNYLVDDPIVTC